MNNDKNEDLMDHLGKPRVYAPLLALGVVIVALSLRLDPHDQGFIQGLMQFVGTFLSIPGLSQAVWR